MNHYYPLLPKESVTEAKLIQDQILSLYWYVEEKDKAHERFGWDVDSGLWSFRISRIHDRYLRFSTLGEMFSDIKNHKHPKENIEDVDNLRNNIREYLSVFFPEKMMGNVGLEFTAEQFIIIKWLPKHNTWFISFDLPMLHTKEEAEKLNSGSNSELKHRIAPYTCCSSSYVFRDIKLCNVLSQIKKHTDFLPHIELAKKLGVL